jgi:LuxR family maltose regulon positive regulatory protein
MQPMSLQPARALRAVPSAARQSITLPVGSDLIVETKLFAPGARAAAISRLRLESRLDEALGKPLAVVVAPAGCGKTSLVNQWLLGTSVGAGWVSLDRADDDAVRFWRYFLLAIGNAAEGTCVNALHRLEAAGADLHRDVLPLVINELARAAAPIVIVLDDYHLIGNGDVHTSLTALLDLAPPQLHVIICSRSDPPLALGRRRVAGQLVELRAEHLRFTVDEAAELLRRALGIRLSEEDVDRLVVRTEGWAAGLQLAALRLADRPDQRTRAEFIDRFTGADRHVVDYLGEEVLATLPADVRDFLLRTSVLNRICGPLADAVTGRRDASRLLDEAYRANLFLTPCDEDLRWFRYHHLFRGILQHELNRAAPGAIAELHRRAAVWFAEAGEPLEAIPHALQSGDEELACRLVAESWRDEFNASHLQTVQFWLDALGAEACAADVRLSVARIWLALDAGHLATAATALSTAERTAPDDPHVQVLRALHTYKVGDVGTATALLAAISGPIEDPFVRTVRELLIGVCALWRGDVAQAQVALEATTRTATNTGNGLARVYALGCRAVLAAEANDFAQTRQLLATADAQVRDDSSDEHFVAMFPALGRARLSAATGDWAEAGEAAERAVELARRGAGRVELAAALITAAHLPRASGGDSRGLLLEAGAVLRTCPDAGALVPNWFAAEQRAARDQRTAGLEQLTERERAILTLLPGPLTQRELADALFVTPNTLKTHLRAIYRKLGAQSRSDAVVRARAAGLL